MKPVPEEFDTIRSFDDCDLQRILPLLFDDPQFCALLHTLFPQTDEEALKKAAFQCETILDLQKRFLYPFVQNIIQTESAGAVFDTSNIPDKQCPYTFISNHRDIVLDPALLCFLLIDNGFPNTAEIAIGDNLLVYDWIKNIVRLNRAFIVQRSLGMREMLLASRCLSAYMHYVITQKRHCIWIAQREGRAKDSSDHTQESVLKMMALGGPTDPTDALREMNIVPLTLSYEYDPCDYLKAAEFQLKRDNPNYVKSQQDDLQNMQTGIQGKKGRICFKAGRPLNFYLERNPQIERATLFNQVAGYLDKEIHTNYTLFPGNYIAADMLSSASAHADCYNEQDQQVFAKYLKGQLEKITLPQPDTDYLTERILTMYANPVFNKERATDVL